MERAGTSRRSGSFHSASASGMECRVSQGSLPTSPNRTEVHSGIESIPERLAGGTADQGRRPDPGRGRAHVPDRDRDRPTARTPRHPDRSDRSACGRNDGRKRGCEVAARHEQAGVSSSRMSSMIPPSAAGPAIVPIRVLRSRSERQPAADALQGHARAAAARQGPRPERHPRGTRRGIRGVHHLAVHGVDGRPRLSVGGGAQRDRPVLPEHGDRAVHAGHRRNRRGRLRPLLEAVGRAVLRLHDRAEHVARLGDERGDDLHVPHGRWQCPAHHVWRPRRLGRCAHGLAGRLSDTRAGAVLQGGAHARLSRDRDRRRRSRRRRGPSCPR